MDDQKGSTVFSVLDLKSGYYQLPLNPDDRSKTAFVCHRGLFEFNMLPFGLSTAPSAFQETIVLMLGDALNRYAIAYLDDIIIYSKSPEEHLKHLQLVFSKLRAANLKLKESKCLFFQREVSYLGHIVSSKGIQPDPEKIRAIQSLRTPNSVKQVRSFVGMASYYRSFIPNFSDLLSPIIYRFCCKRAI